MFLRCTEFSGILTVLCWWFFVLDVQSASDVDQCHLPWENRSLHAFLPSTNILHSDIRARELVQTDLQQTIIAAKILTLQYEVFHGLWEHVRKLPLKTFSKVMDPLTYPMWIEKMIDTIEVNCLLCQTAKHWSQETHTKRCIRVSDVPGASTRSDPI